MARPCHSATKFKQNEPQIQPRHGDLMRLKEFNLGPIESQTLALEMLFFGAFSLRCARGMSMAFVNFNFEKGNGK